MYVDMLAAVFQCTGWECVLTVRFTDTLSGLIFSLCASSRGREDVMPGPHSITLQFKLTEPSEQNVTMAEDDASVGVVDVLVKQAMPLARTTLPLTLVQMPLSHCMISFSRLMQASMLPKLLWV